MHTLTKPEREALRIAVKPTMLTLITPNYVARLNATRDAVLAACQNLDITVLAVYTDATKQHYIPQGVSRRAHH